MKEELKKEIEKICLAGLGISSKEEMYRWSDKSHNGGYWIKGLSEAADVLSKNKQTPILICGDYDVDGDASISILTLAFKEAGFTDVRYRAPRRFSEGFGLNCSMVDEANSGIIITCDNGIAALDAVKKAKDKGLYVIVTDHHLPVRIDGNVILPEADIIIDPNAIKGSAEFSGYCGAGICYKLALELLGRDNAIMPKLEALAACATVADVMELREENFVIVKEGLEHMKDRQTTKGLAALLDEFKIEAPGSYDLGFRIGPAFNAPGRLIDDGSLKSVELMSNDDDKEAAKKQARFLHNVNERRKELVKKGTDKALKIISDAGMENDTFLVVSVPEVSEGVIGILAGQLTEKFGVPSIVFTDIGGGILKGSGRSSTVDLKDTLDKVSGYLVRYGGHAGAAGLSINAEGLDAFRNALISLTKDIPPLRPNNDRYDIEIDLSEAEEAYDIIACFAPFGQGNPDPVFKVNGFMPEPVKDGVIVKEVGNIGRKMSSGGISAVSFDDDLNKRLDGLKEGQTISVVGTLSANTFRGETSLQIMANGIIKEERR